MLRTRFVYLIAATAVCIAGLASRRFRGQLPAFVAEYAGELLWALMVFLLVSTLLVGRPILVRAAISLALAFLVEFSQLLRRGVLATLPRQSQCATQKERLSNSLFSAAGSTLYSPDSVNPSAIVNRASLRDFALLDGVGASPYRP
ncbi:DUF2809 domain-containing protein [Pirellulaceae bacterium SH449]